jgi:hypothetical protein
VLLGQFLVYTFRLTPRCLDHPSPPNFFPVLHPDPFLFFPWLAMVTALSYTEELDSENEKKELLPKFVVCTECKGVRVQEVFPALGQTAKDTFNPPPSKRRRLRRALHHHKTPYAYQDAPFFETPCPLCFFKQCRKVLRQRMRKQKKPFSAITVQIDRLTSEQYEENVSAFILNSKSCH